MYKVTVFVLNGSLKGKEFFGHGPTVAIAELAAKNRMLDRLADGERCQYLVNVFQNGKLIPA